MRTVRIPVPAGRPKDWSMVAAAGGVLLLALLGGCTIKSPQVPSTDFTLSIPIADDMTTIGEVVGDRTEFLRLDSDDLMTLNFSADFERREEIGDRLSVTPTSSTFSTELGDIHLPGQSLPEISLSLGDLLDEDVTEGTIPAIPAASIDERVDIPLASVELLSISSGGIDVAIANDLPLSLEGLALTLIDMGADGAVVQTLDLGAVAGDGGAAAGTFDLSGKEVSGQLAIGVSAGTPMATDVVVAGNPQLRIAAVLQDLIVTRALAVIPEQAFSDQQVLEFPDDRIQVTRADIARGGLALRVRNDLPIAMEVAFSLDELLRPDGTPNTFVVGSLQPGETREDLRFDLDANEFAPADPLRMRLSYSARTLASDGPVDLASDGEIVIEAITEELVFSRVEGVLNRVSLSVDPITEVVDFPEGLGNVELVSTSMAVYLTSAVGFRSRIDLVITGTNNDGDAAVINVSEVFERGNPENPVSVVIEPNPAELTGFLNLLPTSVTVEPTVLLGDGLGTEVIEPSHWIQIDSVRFAAPARFTITEQTEIRPDPEYYDLQDNTARERIESNLVDARVITNIENHMPLGVSVSLRVANWRSIVRDVIVRDRPELAGDEALRAWLLDRGVWDLIGPEDRKEVRERIETLLDLDPGSLKGGTPPASLQRITARLQASDATEARALFTNLLLASLQNDPEDGGDDREVEEVLGRDISEDEWREAIAENVYARPDLRIPVTGGPFRVEAAPLAADGRVAESRSTRREITLTSDEVVVFLRKGGMYTGVLTQLDGTDGQVALYADYYVNVRAGTQINMELNDDLVGN